MTVSQAICVETKLLNLIKYKRMLRIFLKERS